MHGTEKDGISGDRRARLVADETVYDGWTRLRRVALMMGDGARVERHIEDHGDAVAVLPYDPERRTALLVSMPRAPLVDSGEADLYEAIAGALGDEAPEECARREAMEEAGVRLSELQPIGRLWSMPTLSTERIFFYLAPYSAADLLGPGGGAEDEEENIRVHELPLASLPGLTEAAADLKTALLITALQLRQPHLFA